MVLSPPGATAPAAGLLATLVIDTRGFTEAASFSLSLSGTEIGVDSAFILPGGDPLPATIINGSIHVIVGGTGPAARARCGRRPATGRAP